ncbi:MAG: ABC transporter permease subunit [Anaerolineales bacterium]|nr:ABC transporter permease subunit [Anaerolineales bacterium]
MTKMGASQKNAGSLSLGRIGLVLLGLIIFDAFAMWFIYQMLGDGVWQLAAMVGAVALLVNGIWLHPRGYPLRWMSPGFSFMILISIFPILMTIYYAFTNYGTGHILTKTQSIAVFEARTYLPDDAAVYDYTVFQDENGRYALWLQSQNNEGIFATPDGTLVEGIGPLDGDGIPETVANYRRLTKAQSLRAIADLADIQFGTAPNVVQITARPGEAAQLLPRFVYDPATDALRDQQKDILYTADAERGAFVAADGQELIPGYQIPVGWRNFDRFINNPSFRGPLLPIFIWTFIYAGGTVFIAFSFGLAIALAFGRDMPYGRFIKSLFIIPFAVPGVLSILIWRGLLNPLNGVVSTTLAEMLGQPIGWPPVFSDPFWVKVALIGINVWLVYPYFMLINSGALQAIPQDMYEAAEIDGANAWQQFRYLTLPLLLVGVGPLLIGSFIANFNSFNTIYLFNDGGPPIAGAATPAGHSDILISYVYRLAFGGGGGQDFGYAAAISMIIFVILLLFTLLQFRYMRIWEGVGENV